MSDQRSCGGSPDAGVLPVCPESGALGVAVADAGVDGAVIGVDGVDAPDEGAALGVPVVVMLSLIASCSPVALSRRATLAKMWDNDKRDRQTAR